MNLKFGKITEVDAAKGLAKVTFAEDDNLVTRFLPMSVPKSLKDKYSIPFDINEHVWCIMDENCEDGVIGGAIYDSKNTPGGAIGKSSVHFVGNMSVDYDRATATLKISGAGNVEIDTTGDVTIKCNHAIINSLTSVDITAVTAINLNAPMVTASAAMTVTASLAAAAITTAPGAGLSGNMSIAGNITSTGSITAAEINEGAIRLSTHKHIGVQTGAGTSGTPI